MGFKLAQTSDTSNKQTATSIGIEALLQKEVRFFGSQLSNKKKEDFYGQLAVLLKAGVHLREALAIYTQSLKKDKQRSYFTYLLQDLDRGLSFSELLKARKEFTEYEYYSIHIGEQSGTLAQIVSQLAQFFGRKNEQRKNLLNALTYPTIILCTALLVVIFMLRMVVPMFEDIFKQNGVTLPTITRAIIGASNFLSTYGLSIALGLLGLFVVQRFLFKNERFRKKKQEFLLRIPVLGTFLRTVYLAQFTQAVALLTASKVPMVNSLQMAKRMISFLPLRAALQQLEEEIVGGASLHASISKNALFDAKMAALIKVAEETNQTEYIFEKLNQQYAATVQQQSKTLSTVLEPFIILVIGGIVGVILVAMYLPMFQLSSVLG